ncbi:GNAT family N-acetyltransferase [Streptomyces sp. Tue6028]|uniref:GNAT family N-acetyltransferase n=1 Tax=Streptomyces sp. Tue6028 TaxID=2036037 RepID=UPI003D72C20F
MTTHFLRALTGPDAVNFLATVWRDLYAQDELATPFQSSEWLTGWARQLPAAITPLVLTAVSATGRPLAALALARESGRRSRVFPLSAPMAEYIRPVGPCADEMAATFGFHLVLLAEHGIAVEMTDVPAASGLGRYLRRTCQDPSWGGKSSEGARCPLPIAFETLSRSTHKSHQRRIRTWSALVREGRVRYTRTHSTWELLNAYSILARLQDDRGNRPIPLPDTRPAPALNVHWRDVLAIVGAAGAFIATLAVDDVAVAARLCLVRGKGAYSVIHAMDPAHRHRAPGHALMRYLTDDLSSDGFRTLDLGRTQPGERADKSAYRPEWTGTISAVSAAPAAAA